MNQKMVRKRGVIQKMENYMIPQIEVRLIFCVHILNLHIAWHSRKIVVAWHSRKTGNR